MQRPKQKRYWAGKAPDWVQEEDEQTAAPAPAPAPLPPPAAAAAAAADPRLARLMQRGGASERRGPTEAVVVQRRRHRSPPPEEEEEAKEERRAVGGAPAQPQRAAPADDDDGEAADDEEAIAARRAAIRARQLAAAAEAAAAASDEEEEEDSSEYTTDDESDSDGAPVMLKPAFVPKTDRETLAEREAVLAAAEQTTRQEAEQLEERRRQTQELLAHAQLHEAQQDAPADDEGELDTDDEKDEVAQYESWRERELLRIARDRQLRQAGTKAEAAAQAAAAGGTAGAPPPQPKKKWKFLQKYWHKGAFFQGDDEEGVLGDVLRRDYDAPTGEDKVDKDMLPKIMQVRNFGRRGRTKWTHLLAEDTSMQQAADYAAPAAGARQPSQQVQDFSKPRNFKT